MQKHRWLFIFLGVAALGVAVVFGAAFGAGLTYFFLHADPVQAAFTSPMQIQMRGENNEVGVLIAGVETGSAAETAGLVRGDIILEVNGNAMNSLFDLQNALSELAPGESAELTVLHGDETRMLTAELSDRAGLAYLGVNTCGGPMDGAMMFNAPMGDVRLEVVLPAAEVTEVIAGSPAEMAGLQVGDVIIGVEGEKIGQDVGLADLIQTYAPGDKVILEVQSAGAEETREVSITLGENPDNPGQAYLGVGYRMGSPTTVGPESMPRFFFHNGEEFQGQLPESGDQDGQQFFFHGMPGTGTEGLPYDLSQLPEGFEGAVIITEVVDATPAAEAGLQPGDLILAADGETISDVETFVSLMQSHKPGDEVTLTVFRAGEEIKVTVTLAEHPDDPAKGYLGVMAGSFSVDQIKVPAPSQDFEFELPGVPGGDA
jgi:S1-C subfamily serine protease